MPTNTRVTYPLAHDISGRGQILNVHAIVPGSRANGPGIRTVVWVQGCSRRCPGCFNPETHDRAARRLIVPEDLVQLIEAVSPRCEGVTVSGGEPLEQAAALLSFLKGLRRNTSLSAMLFSGYTLNEVLELPSGPDIVAHLDVLVAGPFIQEQRVAKGLLGSSNQHIHVLTDRYALSDLLETPCAEITIDAQGHIGLSGLDPPCLSPIDEWMCTNRSR